MMKKILIAILVVLVVFALLAFAYHFYLNNDGKLDMDNPLSKEEVISLLKKGATYPNLYFYMDSYYKEEGQKDWQKITTEYYIKNNIAKCVVNSELFTIDDYKKNQRYSFMTPEHVYTSPIEKASFPNQYGYDYSFMTNENNSYQYLGEKEMEGRTNILIKITQDPGSYTKYFIDKETGVILNQMTYSLYGFQKFSNTRIVKFDIVTDQDVMIPDLSNYKVNVYE